MPVVVASAVKVTFAALNACGEDFARQGRPGGRMSQAVNALTKVDLRK